MGLLSSSNNEDKESKTENEDSYEDNWEVKEFAEVKKTVEKEEDYTEHRAEIHHANGDSTEVVFDEMVNHGDVIELQSYVGFTEKTDRGCGHRSEYTTYRGFDAEAFMSIPVENLNRLHTVERTDKTWTYEVEETEVKPVEEVEEDEEVIERFNKEVRK